jgi:hypothetical protein
VVVRLLTSRGGAVEALVSPARGYGVPVVVDVNHRERLADGETVR